MIKETIEACFNRLQGLEIRATLQNMEALVQTLYDLKQIYQELTEEENETDPERRNGD